MQLDIETLLAPLPGDQPQGNAIDYDGDFQALERELEGRPEQQYGTTVIPAQEPDWTKVRALAEQLLLGKSKDFRLAVILTRALTRISGPHGAAQGLSLLIAMIDRYWQNGYPLLVDDGEDDLLPRSNALASLTASSGLLGDLRASEISSPQLGKLSLGTLERIALSREGATNEQLTREQLPRFLADELNAGNPQLPALPLVRDHILSLQNQLSHFLNAEYLPDFSSLLGFLGLFCPTSSVPSEISHDSAPPVPTEALPQPPSQDLSAANSRQQAIDMLDAVCDFLERTEPANPAPLLIRRARNMIGADFLSILRDLAPTGLAEAERIAGVLKEN